MPVSRESLSISTTYKFGGSKKVIRLLKNMFHGYFNWKLFLEDNVGPIICHFKGHDEYLSDGDLACKRCHQYIKK